MRDCQRVVSVYKEGGGKRNIVGVVNRFTGGSEVPLRGFCCKARGGVAVACDKPL